MCALSQVVATEADLLACSRVCQMLIETNFVVAGIDQSEVH